MIKRSIFVPLYIIIIGILLMFSKSLNVLAQTARLDPETGQWVVTGLVDGLHVYAVSDSKEVAEGTYETLAGDIRNGDFDAYSEDSWWNYAPGYYGGTAQGWFEAPRDPYWSNTTNYSCLNGQCIQDSNGIYTDLNHCQAQACNPGSTQNCTTLDLCPGTQTCNSNGCGWSSCVKNDPNCPPSCAYLCQSKSYSGATCRLSDNVCQAGELNVGQTYDCTTTYHRPPPGSDEAIEIPHTCCCSNPIPPSFSVLLTANGQTGTVSVNPNEDVTLTATPSNGQTPYQSYDWYIGDKSVSGGCHLTNPSDGSKHKGCQKMSYLPFFDQFSFFGKLALAAVGNTNTIKYQWSQPGTYKINVVVKDSANKTAINTVTIIVSIVPPTIPPTVPPTIPPPPTCQILSFTINDKDNSTQNPLIVWVNTPLVGSFSVNDQCLSCIVTNNNPNAVWGDTTGTPYPINYSTTGGYIKTDPPFKITTAGTYAYTLKCTSDPVKDPAECQLTDPNCDIDVTSLAVQPDGSGGVKAINLPWWREIIPNLGGFLRGMIRFK